MKWTGHNIKCIFSQLKNKICIHSYYCTSFLQPHQYTEEEQKKILETLQLCAEENFSRYHLTEKKLQNIKQFLKTHGKFTNLDEILTIDGMGPQSSSFIFKSILNNDNPLGGTKLKRVTGLLTPSFDKIKHKKIEFVTGINIGFNAISWTSLNCRNGEIIDFNVQDKSSIFDKKCNIHSIYEIADEIYKSLPDSDICIMENINWSNLGGGQISPALQVQRALLATAIMTMFNIQNNVNSPDEEYPTNCVYFLRPLVSARLFKTLVGSEKVSAQNIVINIFQKVPDERYSDVTISTELYDNYNSLEGFLKENMGWSLLLVIAFRELILLNNPKALAIVSQRSIKKV